MDLASVWLIVLLILAEAGRFDLFWLVLAVWIALNTVVIVVRPPDPYPFILLNLVLSCLAAIQAPIIMMSQNRQEAKIVCVRNTITKEPKPN